MAPNFKQDSLSLLRGLVPGPELRRGLLPLMLAEVRRAKGAAGTTTKLRSLDTISQQFFLGEVTLATGRLLSASGHNLSNNVPVSPFRNSFFVVIEPSKIIENSVFILGLGGLQVQGLMFHKVVTRFHWSVAG